MDRLLGKTAVITGGAGGIGKGIAQCMQAEGAEVIIIDIAQPDYDVTAWRADVTKPDEVKAVAQEILSRYSVDILVNNAGIEGAPGNPFTLNTIEDWDKVWQTNVLSAVLVSQAFAPHFMERKSGCIITIGSIAGLMPGPMSPPYSVSKVAVMTFAQIMAKQLAYYGVRSNAIAPGLVWTPHWERLAKDNIQRYPEKFGRMTPRQIYDQRIEEIVPLKREQTVEDVGLAAVFLASDEARNITGQILNVDGGVVI